MSETTVALRVGDTPVSHRFPPLTRHDLALYCGASGDHHPLHVDLDYARAAGFPDVFAHGMFVMARLGVALGEAFPPGRVREYGVRFTSITQLGAELLCEGRVTALETEDGEPRARLEMTASDQHGDVKVKGEAVVALVPQ